MGAIHPPLWDLLLIYSLSWAFWGAAWGVDLLDPLSPPLPEICTSWTSHWWAFFHRPFAPQMPLVFLNTSTNGSANHSYILRMSISFDCVESYSFFTAFPSRWDFPFSMDRKIFAISLCILYSSFFFGLSICISLTLESLLAIPLLFFFYTPGLHKNLCDFRVHFV